MDYYRDRIAIVTGGASGIGRMLCEELASRNAVVIIADVNLGGAQAAAEEISNRGGRASAERIDVSRADEVQALVARVATEKGRLDLMFNNAGIAVGGEVRDIGLELWRRIVDVNLFGVINGTTAAYGVMVKQGFGHIVNTASLAGLVPVSTMTPYGTTKFAVVGLSTSLRAEARDLGVKISVVCPGFVQTGIFDAATVVGNTTDVYLTLFPFKLLDARTAAKKILRGVEHNRALIVFPLYARIMWWLARINPHLLSPLSNRAVKVFRRERTGDDHAGG